MRNLTMTLVATAALALGAWQVGKAHDSLETFRFIVERTDKGVDIKCVQGCAWRASLVCDKPSHSAAPSIVLGGVRVMGDTLTSCRFGVSDRGVEPL